MFTFPTLNHIPWSHIIVYQLNNSSTWGLGEKIRGSLVTNSIVWTVFPPPFTPSASCEHTRWSTNRPRHCVERLPPVSLTFCPFTPIIPAAPGWPCSRALRLMTVMQQCGKCHSGEKHIQDLPSAPFPRWFRSRPVSDESRMESVTGSQGMAKKCNAPGKKGKHAAVLNHVRNNSPILLWYSA